MTVQKSVRGWLPGKEEFSVWVTSLGEVSPVCLYLEKETDGHEASMEAEWATSRG